MDSVLRDKTEVLETTRNNLLTPNMIKRPSTDNTAPASSKKPKHLSLNYVKTLNLNAKLKVLADN